MALTRDDFDVIVSSGGGKKSDKNPPLPPPKGQKSLSEDSEVEQVKDWNQIKDEMEQAGLTGEKEKPEHSEEGETGKEKSEDSGDDFIQFEEGPDSEDATSGEQKDGKNNAEAQEEGKSEDAGIPGETPKQKEERLKRQRIKDHNNVVKVLNNIKGFYVKNKELMSKSISDKFEQKIDKLESIVQESAATIK
jgi:hypothetical protein